jgi:hypothetical protein
VVEVDHMECVFEIAFDYYMVFYHKELAVVGIVVVVDMEFVFACKGFVVVEVECLIYLDWYSNIEEEDIFGKEYAVVVGMELVYLRYSYYYCYLQNDKEEVELVWVQE